MKGSISGFIIGLMVFVFTIFLVIAVPQWLIGTSETALTMLRITFLLIGLGAIFIGLMEKG